MENLSAVRQDSDLIGCYYLCVPSSYRIKINRTQFSTERSIIKFS